jgi:predicted metal-binding protein
LVDFLLIVVMLFHNYASDHQRANDVEIRHPSCPTVASACDSCHQDDDGAAVVTRQWLKREHGEDDPEGADAVAAPATVSGKRIHTMSLAKSREDVIAQRPASQETCHRPDQPQRTGCSDGKELASAWRSTALPHSRHLLSGPTRRRKGMAKFPQHKIVLSTDCCFTGGPCRPGAELLALLNRSVAALGTPLSDDFAVTGTVCMAACTRPCTIAFQAGGSATYLFGDVSPEENVDDLVRYAAACAGGIADPEFGWDRTRHPAAFIVSEATAGRFQ